MTAATFSDAPLLEGEPAVPLRGKLKVTFSQAMDPASTSILLDTRALDPKMIVWDAAGTAASTDLTLTHSRSHAVTLQKSAAHRRPDQAIAA